MSVGSGVGTKKMKKKEHFFVFLGQSFMKTAETFSLMMQTLHSNLKPAPILSLTQEEIPQKEIELVLDFSNISSFAPNQIMTATSTTSITVKVEPNSEIEIVVLGAQGDLESFDVSRQIEIQSLAHSPRPKCTAEEDVHKVNEISSDIDVPVVRADMTLLAAPSISHIKPVGNILIESGFYNRPGSFKWLTNRYMEREVFQAFADTVLDTGILRSDLLEYPKALEIIEFLEAKDTLKMEAADFLTSFNRTICDNFIGQVAMKLEYYSGNETVTLELQDEALRNAAVFVPLLYHESFATSFGDRVAEHFKAIFARPVPTTNDLYELVIRDLNLRHSVTYFHESNREMLEQEIFRSPIDLPFYGTDNCLDTLAALQANHNLLQEHLERKERFYAGHQRRILRKCLARIQSSR